MPWASGLNVLFGKERLQPETKLIPFRFYLPHVFLHARTHAVALPDSGKALLVFVWLMTSLNLESSVVEISARSRKVMEQ